MFGGSMKIIVFSLLIFLPIVFQNCSDANFSNSDTFSGKRQASESDLSCSEGLCEDIGSDIIDEGLVDQDDDTDSINSGDGNRDHDEKSPGEGDYANRDDQAPPSYPNTEEPNLLELIEHIFAVEDLKPLSSETCAELFTALEGGMNLDGQSLKINANFQRVIVKNAGDVKINGNTRLLVIDGAKNVKVSGNVGSLCIRAQHIDGINGNVVGGRQAHIIIGQNIDGQKALAKNINGNTSVSTLVLDIDVEKINGNSNYLSIKNSDVDKINGNTRSLHIENVTLEELNGNAGELVLKKSLIKKVNGNIRKLEYDEQSALLEINGNIN